MLHDSGIAVSLAKEGADIVLHGLGDPEEIERVRRKRMKKRKIRRQKTYKIERWGRGRF